ncbi:hypothetical protein D9757_013482 [Collybiopsis confluens]|uniref:Cupin type-2 domain-containing protein n=1 Tax=Collybiopsis confluens TaxID=2823264 RepID=A0A8H5FQU2_9AGAR|nr:hypothetical protein D9757_013482 [Collybiopsis confluens]
MSNDYSDTFELAKGVSLTLKPQERVARAAGGEGDDILLVPMHWHENHDEVMTVLEGKVKITLGREVKICTPESGAVFIPRGTPHAVESFKGVPAVIVETTKPSDFDTKELFFRNLLAIPGGLNGSLIPAMQVFYHGDGYPVFPLHFKWLEKLFVITLGAFIAPLLGYRIKYATMNDIKQA